MKCDELKPLVYSLKDLSYVDETAVENNFDNPHDHAVYKATEVDAAIAELKGENESLKGDIADLRDDRKSSVAIIDELNAENAQLKAKLESVQASMYADMLDAGMENRKLKRALWLARAERAIEKIAWFKLWNASISTMNPEDGARQEFDKWKKALGKFLAKAEQYK